MDKFHKSLHERAIRLVEGGIVQVDGHSVKAVKSPVDMFPCDVCNMDCLCHRDLDTDMTILCEEVGKVGRDGYYLKLIDAQ